MAQCCPPSSTKLHLASYIAQAPSLRPIVARFVDDPDAVDPCGPSPLLIHLPQLRRLTPEWLKLSFDLKRDPQADKVFGWVLEMWGYVHLVPFVRFVPFVHVVPFVPCVPLVAVVPFVSFIPFVHAAVRAPLRVCTPQGMHPSVYAPLSVCAPQCPPRPSPLVRYTLAATRLGIRHTVWKEFQAECMT